MKYLSDLKQEKNYRETVWSFFMKGTAALFFITLNIYLARYLGPNDFGTWSFFYSILNIVLLISYLGINDSSKKFAAQHNETENLGSILKSSIIIRVVVSLGVALLFLILFKPLANLLGRQELEILFKFAVPLLFFSGLVEYYKHIFEGLHRLKFAFFINFTEYGLKLLFTVVLISLFDGLVSIVLSFNLALLAASLVGGLFWYLKFYKPNMVSGDNFNREIIKYSLPLFFISVGSLVAVELDVVMIGILSSDAEVGIYAVAKQIIVKLPHIAMAISLGTMPVFAKLNSSNREELTRLFYNLLKANTVIFGSIGIFILSAGWFFVPLLFGESYGASVYPLMILVVYLLLYSYTIFLSTFLDYQGLATKRALNLSLTVVLNIFFNLLLIPRYGAVGAAIGTSASYAPYVVLNWLETRKFLVQLEQ